MYRLFSVPDSYHEILCEKKIYRESVMSMAIDFFDQREDSVENVKPQGPVFEGDFDSVYSISTMVFKTSGVIIALGVGIAGISMVISGRRR